MIMLVIEQERETFWNLKNKAKVSEIKRNFQNIHPCPSASTGCP